MKKITFRFNPINNLVLAYLDCMKRKVCNHNGTDWNPVLVQQVPNLKKSVRTGCEENWGKIGKINSYSR
jgi:hypothetical protein